MRLGELRTIIRDFDNRLVVRLACYSEKKGVQIHDLDFDMSNDNEMYLRVVGSVPHSLEAENNELKMKLARVEREFCERGILTESEFLELIE